MVYEIADTSRVAPLFGDWEETIIWSCIQGVMGKIYADDLNDPKAAMAVLGDFVFFAGEPDSELVSFRPDGRARKFRIIVPQNGQWQEAIIRVYKEKAKITTRYAIKKEPHVFDVEKLSQAVDSLPQGYTLSMIDERLYHMCREEDWSADLVSQFSDYEQYRALGIGAAICKEGSVVSGASSYSRYEEGIEIEIDTKEEYRRKGLAYICGAKLILECMEQNLYPSWDAQNKSSAALAEKLGYHFSHEYTVVEVWDE